MPDPGVCSESLHHQRFLLFLEDHWHHLVPPRLRDAVGRALYAAAGARLRAGFSAIAEATAAVTALALLGLRRGEVDDRAATSGCGWVRAR